MAILTRARAADAVVLATREPTVETSPERHAQVSAFYTELLGLRAWADELQIPGGWGAGPPRRGAYFQFRHDPRVDPMRRRLVICVPSLDAVAERLDARHWAYARLRGLGPAERCLLVTDPAGHRVELRQHRNL